MEKVMSKIEKAGSKLGNILDNVDTLAGNLSSIFRKVNDGKGTLGRLLNDEKIASDLEKTVASAKKTVSTANKAAEGLSDNMEAAKSNFLLRGFFKKKEKKRIADSTAKAKALKLKAMQNKPPKKN
jgi:phospholipid/cholesterol/gamma-HCH transport system substrate-binding protein